MFGLGLFSSVYEYSRVVNHDQGWLSSSVYNHETDLDIGLDSDHKRNKKIDEKTHGDLTYYGE